MTIDQSLNSYLGTESQPVDRDPFTGSPKTIGKHRDLHYDSQQQNYSHEVAANISAWLVATTPWNAFERLGLTEGESLSSGPSWSTKQTPCQPGLYSETLSQKAKTNNNNKNARTLTRTHRHTVYLWPSHLLLLNLLPQLGLKSQRTTYLRVALRLRGLAEWSSHIVEGKKETNHWRLGFG